MAGYSGTPLVRKLGIKQDHQVVLFHAPPDFRQLLVGLPDGVSFQTEADLMGPANVVLLFCTTRNELQKHFTPLMRCLQPGGVLWVAWPKRAAKVATDVSEDAVREIGLATGMVDNKVCAIDATWSGLRFVFRRAAKKADK